MMQYCIIILFQLLSLTEASESGIVSGKVAKPHSRPYMVSLQVRGGHVCGGILIRKDFVLTSAHCKMSEDIMTVVLGAQNITKKEKSQQSIPVAKFYQNPNFTGKFHYDIMLLKLMTNAELNQYVKVIELPTKEEIPANTKCSVAGWGQSGPETPGSDVLRETTVKVQFNFECSNKWREHFSSDQMICTHTGRKKGGICQGDSGGPLICNTKPQGISAFTKMKNKKDDKGCDDPKYPHVFMKIHFFLPWIKTVMKG
ncbi:granzyme B-like [Centroberyx affinis]|uniref:granzyme B-like n=1 Tax=Centroberyx affinis TaxID=166261 RepID=UPI003A5C0A50